MGVPNMGKEIIEPIGMYLVCQLVGVARGSMMFTHNIFTMYKTVSPVDFKWGTHTSTWQFLISSVGLVFS